MRIIFIASIALVSLTPVAVCQDAGDARKGATYARKVCAECHAISDEQTSSPSSKAPSFSAVANAPGMTATALIVWFRTPHPTMPNLIIEPQNQKDLAAYIMSLRKSP
jgi:mono/diheme cytochrome c family protein